MSARRRAATTAAGAIAAVTLLAAVGAAIDTSEQPADNATADPTSVQPTSVTATNEPAPAVATPAHTPGQVIQATIAGAGGTNVIHTSELGAVQLTGTAMPGEPQCGATWAISRLNELLPPGSLVAITITRTDNSGQIAAGDVRTTTGALINELLIREGLAKLSADHEDSGGELARAAREAETTRAGSWQACQWAQPATTTPTAAPPPTATPTTARQPPATTAAPPPTPSDGGGVYYQNCAAARAAGAAPVHHTDPGYRPALDRDGDGVGCE